MKDRSSKSGVLERVQKASDAWKQSTDAYVSLLAYLIPVGALVTVELGGNVLSIRVTGHQRWSGGIGELTGVNVRTGKHRFFHWSDILSVDSTGDER